MRIANWNFASIFGGDVVNLSSGCVISKARQLVLPYGCFLWSIFTATDGTPTFSKSYWTGGTATLGSADAEGSCIQ